LLGLEHEAHATATQGAEDLEGAQSAADEHPGWIPVRNAFRDPAVSFVRFLGLLREENLQDLAEVRMATE